MGLMLGPFELEEQIGLGGMGEVWRGRHLGHGELVAIKVITAPRDHKSDYLSAFEREVQAQAAMDHVGILRVFDYGQLPAALEAQSKGMLSAGSPYLVMEYASGGSLDSHPLSDWAQLYGVIVASLRALAHAHARHLVHLDLKPANVLCSRPLHASQESRDFEYKLGDFGIAFATHASNVKTSKLRETSIMGTPAYMAPEQLLGQWRSFGPWTDLYAFGCMIWELLHDKTPFEAPSILGLAIAHLQQAPPPYAPRFSVPAALEGWILRLLKKAPHQRFECAADALAAFEALSEGFTLSERSSAYLSAYSSPQTQEQPMTMLLEPVPDLSLEETLDSYSALGDALKGRSAGELMEGDHPWRAFEPRKLKDTQAPRPSPNWRLAQAPEVNAATTRLAGVGLGLWGLRATPLIGREVERDKLWGGLNEVWQTQEMRLVLLDGAPGQGKSALMQWLERLAHERGAATTMRAVYAEQPGPLDGLQGMLSLNMRLIELERDAIWEHIYERLRAWVGLEPDDARQAQAAALTAWVSPDEPDELIERLTELPRVRFSSPRERHLALCQYITQLAMHRPVMLHIEGLHHSLQAMEFLELALEYLEDAPVLIVASVSREQIPMASWAERSLESIMAHPQSSLLHLGALEPAAHQQLINHLLGLEPRLAKRVESLTAGQPLFAVQLIQDWVERGLLRSTPAGFTLTQAPEAMTLPSSVAALCEQRLGHLIARQGAAEDEAWCALELAAALGQDILAQEWSQVCALASVHVQPALLGALVVQGMARRTAQGWAFQNQLFIKALEQHARQANRWQRHHLRCARMLMATQAQQRSNQVLERAGLHYLVAQEYELALDALLEVIPMLDGAHAQQLIHQAQEALELATARATPPQLSQLEQLLGKLTLLGQVPWMIHTGKLEQARARFDQEAPERLVEGHAMRLDVLLVGAQLCLFEQDYAQGLKLGLSARALLDEGATHQQEAHQGRCFKLLGELYHFSAEHERARELFELAIKTYEEAGLWSGRAWALYNMASCEIDMGLYEQAQVHLIASEQAMREVGDRVGVSYAQSVQAVLYYDQGDYERALKAFKSAQQLQEEIGDAGVWVTRENYARCLIKLERYQEALPVLRAIERQSERLSQGVFANYVGDAILSCHAGLRDWATWRAYYPEAMRQLEREAQRDEILVEALQETLHLVIEGGEAALAQPLIELLLSLCEELDLEERAEQVRQRANIKLTAPRDA